MLSGTPSNHRMIGIGSLPSGYGLGRERGNAHAVPSIRPRQATRANGLASEAFASRIVKENPSSRSARAKAAVVGTLPRKNTWTSVDMVRPHKRASPKARWLSLRSRSPQRALSSRSQRCFDLSLARRRPLLAMPLEPSSLAAGSPGRSGNQAVQRRRPMHGIIYLIGLIVVIMAILSLFGLR